MKRKGVKSIGIGAFAACCAIAIIGCGSPSVSPTEPLVTNHEGTAIWDVVIAGTHVHEGVLFIDLTQGEVFGGLTWLGVRDFFLENTGDQQVEGTVNGSRFSFTLTSRDCTLDENGRGSVVISADGRRLEGTLHGEALCDHAGDPEEWSFVAVMR